MKNYYQTLVSLLIAGILSLTTAHPHSSIENEFSSDSALPPNVQFMRNWFEEKCHRNGGPGAFEAVMKLPENMRQCMRSVVDIDELRNEFEIAGRRNDITPVIKKYCKRIPEIEKCMGEMSNVITSCLDPEDKEGLKVNDKITSAVLEFVCHNDGERITAFLSNGGPACVRRMRPQLEVCADANFGKFLSDARSEVFDLSEHPLMNLNQEKCSNLENFKTCAVAALEICPHSITAIMAEEIFASIRKVTPCEEQLYHSPIATPTTGKPTDRSDSDITMEELVRKNLLKQTEAAEAQVRAANAQEKAAHAQEQAARVMEQVGKNLLKNRLYA